MSDRLTHLENLLMDRGVLRVAELRPLGFPKTYLGELAKRGRAVRHARGIYLHPEAEMSGNYSLALACSKIPQGVICLLSALRFHEMGTESPHEVWIAIDRKARIPKLEYPAPRIVRFSGAALSEGICHSGGEFPIRVYSPAKTVADCFKYRWKIGIDVAIEALKSGWRNRLFTVDELNYFACICRVEKIISPYLEAIL